MVAKMILMSIPPMKLTINIAIVVRCRIFFHCVNVYCGWYIMIDDDGQRCSSVTLLMLLLICKCLCDVSSYRYENIYFITIYNFYNSFSNNNEKDDFLLCLSLIHI